MLYWALVFFVIAIASGIFGFGGLADATAGVAQLFFYVFAIFFVMSFIAGLFGDRRNAPRFR